MAEQWEYKRLEKSQLIQDYGDPDKGLNALGNEGWELVDIESNVLGEVSRRGHDGLQTQGWTTTTVTYIFKRRKA